MKTKNIFKILTSTALSQTIVLPFLCACSNNSINITTDFDNKTIQTQNVNFELPVTFSKLPDDSKVSIKIENEKLYFSDIKESTTQITIDSNKTFKLNIGFKTVPTQSTKQEFNLIFTYQLNKTECKTTKKFTLEFQYVEPQPESLKIVGDDVVAINTTKKFITTVSPTMASKDVVWLSSDTTIAEIDQFGQLNAKKEGAVDITVTSKVVPTVADTKRVYIELTDLTINNIVGDESIDVGSNKTYSIESSPSGHQIYCNWTSSDHTLVDIENDPTNNHNVIVKAKKGGTITLTATSKLNSKITKTKTINLDSHISEIKITGNSNVEKNKEYRYEAKVVSTQSVSQLVKWSISESTSTGSYIDSAIGLLHTSNVAGTITIRATSLIDETKYGEFVVTVA